MEQTLYQLLKDFGFPVTLSVVLIVGIAKSLSAIWTYATAQFEKLGVQRELDFQRFTDMIEKTRTQNEKQLEIMEKGFSRLELAIRESSRQWQIGIKNHSNAPK